MTVEAFGQAQHTRDRLRGELFEIYSLGYLMLGGMLAQDGPLRSCVLRVLAQGAEVPADAGGKADESRRLGELRDAGCGAVPVAG